MANSLKDLQQRRREHLEVLTLRDKRALGLRIAASRKLLKTKLATADLHSHSKYSDGQSSVAENAERAKIAGVDLLFATDHGTIRQKRDTDRIPNATWGEESHSGGFDMGLLQPRKVHKYTPDEPAAIGFAKGRDVAPFVWAAHPVGFSPVSKKWFKDMFNRLMTIDNLAMEVLNGFDGMRSYFRTGIWGVKMMDALLCAGKTVTPVGVSDAHYLVEIGNSWTGVLGATKSPASIIKGLQEGRTFASEAPLLALSANGKLMGSTLRPKRGAAVRLKFKAVDSVGLAGVRIISDGKVIKEIHAKGESVVEGALTRKATGRDSYVRLECTASDDRRAFSAAIYLR